MATSVGEHSELDRLRTELGPFGFQWLCACSLFPVLRSPLSLRIGQALAASVPRSLPDVEEQRVLFQLPWFRQGWIPSRMRVRLAAQIMPFLARSLRSEIRAALVEAEHDRRHATIALGGAQALGEQEDGDALLVSFLLGAAPLRLIFVWLNDLARRLGLRPSTLALMRWTRTALIVLAVVGAGTALSLAASQWLARDHDWLPRWLTATHKTQSVRWIPGPVPSPHPLPLQKARRNHKTLPADQSGNAKRNQDENAQITPVDAPGPVEPVTHADAGSGASVSGDVGQGSTSATFISSSADGSPVDVPLDAKWDLYKDYGSSSGGRRPAISPDATHVLQGEQVWNLQTGAEDVPIDDHYISVSTFSNDGRHIVAGGDRGTWVFDAATGKRETALQGAQDPSDVRFSPGDRQIATVTGNVVTTWDAISGAREQAMAGPSLVKAMAFSADGQHLVAVYDDGGVKVWSTATGETVQTFTLGQAVSIAAIALDGSRIAAASSAAVTVWDTATGNTIRTITPKGGVFGMDFSPDGRRLAIAAQQATIWEVDTGRLGTTFANTGLGPYAIGYSHDGTRIVVRADGRSDIRIQVYAPEARPAQPLHQGDAGTPGK